MAAIQLHLSLGINLTPIVAAPQRPTEVRARAKSPPSATKLRGGYYTPAQVSQWLCKWGIRSAGDRVLEPSCGDGSILAAAAERISALRHTAADADGCLVGVELVPEEAEKAAQRVTGRSWARVVPDNFFFWLRRGNEKFDCVIGNPPFVRYQNITEPTRSLSMDLLDECGLRPNRLTNLWVSFVAGAIECLRPGGRLALVIPAELLQVSYAAQLRQHLVQRFSRVEIVGCNQLIFEGAEQEVVLLLAEGMTNAPPLEPKVDLFNFESLDDLLRKSPLQLVEEREFKIVDHASEKWLKYFLDNKEIGLLRALRESSVTATLLKHAEVDVGVVTGNNDFFVLAASQVKELGVAAHVSPVVSRSNQLRGATFAKADWVAAKSAGGRSYLFSTKHSTPRLNKLTRHYIQDAEKRKVHLGYKCSIREPWYSVPSVWTPDAFMFRQIHDFPRMILNKTAATSTDTIHRVTLKGCSGPSLLSSFFTHLTAASAEVEGRSYGGGVLELEPTEAERLLMPASLRVGLSLSEIDRQLRRGRLDLVLSENDRLILQAGCGISKQDIGALKAIWIKMRSRRARRRSS